MGPQRQPVQQPVVAFVVAGGAFVPRPRIRKKIETEKKNGAKCEIFSSGRKIVHL